MKLLLTSAGLTTRALGAALQEMAGTLAGECKVAFVPTAGNVQLYDKSWLANQFISLWKYGFNHIDIVDISAAGVDWKVRFEDADIIYIGGGNTFHLLDQARKTGFDQWLKDNIDNKVYVGSSASSILVTPSIEVAAQEESGDENLAGLTDLTGLNFVGFEIEPHCDMTDQARVEEYAKTRPNAVYAIDDLTAIKVVDDRSEVISDGTWKLYN